jgi:5-methylcytosine-specific restriction endonuclease McrA
MKKYVPNEEELSLILKMYNEELLGSQTISQKIGLSKQVVIRLLKENGIKIGNALRGRKLSIEVRNNMSIGKLGNKNTLGHKHTKETRDKMSQAQIKRVKEGRCHLWKGGISFTPYPVDWTRTLRRSIRERDSYECQMCGAPQEDRAWDIHHIDYDKENCDPNNLITLCHACHSKTNVNREYWTNYFKTKLWQTV